MSNPLAARVALCAAVALCPAAGAAGQTEADEYTRYELLSPGTASFKITYEVTATTAGARFYYNPIRKGSVASDESVYDAMLGTPLRFEVVSGLEARKDPLLADADPDTRYIKVTLARPVPERGGARLLIVKTYRDAASYHRDGEAIVFSRPLGVQRNKVVLPPGYEVVELSVPAQIRTEEDGRIAVSFMHAGAGEAPLVIRALKDAASGEAARPRPPGSQRGAGVNGYANLVRKGSVASHPAARMLDTGEELPAREMSGAELAASRINVGEKVAADDRVVVIPFPAVQAGHTLRLRIAETYTDPVSYRLEGDELVFDRSLGRPRNAVVLPSGWYCTFSAIPATVSRLPDGRVRLDYWDDRPEPVDVLLKARRRIGN